ncbi:hypothetical protein [Pelagibius sp.]|uniref:hypothetical protein n=1 Tax=Pelagibius sp. TaxID=1931238 RepID=UPI00261A7D03|nr:hypothetical protein [Pelagibius sp.]
MTGTSPLLPGGFKRSAWPDLTPADRAVFLQEVVLLTGYQVLGNVNYDSSLEPMLYDPAGDRLVSISGDEIPANPIEVDITKGFFTEGRSGEDIVAVAVLLALVFGVLIFSSRR